VKTDLVEIFQAIDKQCLNEIDIEIDPQSAVTVMLVSGGYPEAYEKGKEITGLEKIENSIIFHAGANNKNGQIVTSGGRVMAVTSFGTDFKSALGTSYKSIEALKF
jgi:phosphoribosylamine--glycine ligase